MNSQKTAKQLGFAKGDFVTADGMPAILVADANRTNPTVEVWGNMHESGAMYAHTLRKITPEQFVDLCAQYGHRNLTAYFDVAKKALKTLKP